MTRQINPSATGLLLRRLGLVPWWAALGLAIASYALLHVTAANLPPASAMLRSIATIGQYGLALLFLAAGAVSVWRRATHRARPSGAAGGDAAKLIDLMNRREFDALMIDAFQMQGYQPVHDVKKSMGGFSAIDLVLRKDRETVFVDCRNWRAAKVGIEVVVSLQSVMTAQGANSGIVVTAGRFSRQATAFARGCNIKLMDGAALHGVLTKAQVKRAAHT